MRKLKRKESRKFAAECVYAAIGAVANSTHPDDDAFRTALAVIVDAYLKGGLKEKVRAHFERAKRRGVMEAMGAGPSSN
jgi:hypothetical protein